ncbi:MAG: proteophosphoglycan precursor [Rhodospirillaceae bacterium]|nr:proteophosphoglycan precursor [Rhodospirillaceae bacterium]|tara:strand:- start:1395 stop:1928 length:534 start_codon:yes stop_codon:yes gene_type:complete
MKKSILTELNVHSSNMPQFCGDIDIRIARNGTWYYRGSEIARKKIVKFFSTTLRRDKIGDFWLETSLEKCRIKVDDAPFLAIGMEVVGFGNNQSITFTTNMDDKVLAGPSFPIHIKVDPKTLEPSPYVLVRDRLEALISRAVYYDLIELGLEMESEGRNILGVWSNGVFFELGSLDE